MSDFDDRRTLSDPPEPITAEYAEWLGRLVRGETKAVPAAWPLAVNDLLYALRRAKAIGRLPCGACGYCAWHGSRESCECPRDDDDTYEERATAFIAEQTGEMVDTVREKQRHADGLTEQLVKLNERLSTALGIIDHQTKAYIRVDAEKHELKAEVDRLKERTESTEWERAEVWRAKANDLNDQLTAVEKALREAGETLRAAKDCDHGITLEGVVETCAECKAVVNRRPLDEAELREALKVALRESVTETHRADKLQKNIDRNLSEFITWRIERRGMVALLKDAVDAWEANVKPLVAGMPEDRRRYYLDAIPWVVRAREVIAAGDEVLGETP